MPALDWCVWNANDSVEVLLDAKGSHCIDFGRFGKMCKIYYSKLTFLINWSR